MVSTIKCITLQSALSIEINSRLWLSMVIHQSTDRTQNHTSQRSKRGTVSYGVFLQDVTHPSTDRAQCFETSVTGQDRRQQCAKLSSF
jgi:hypothetical protein